MIDESLDPSRDQNTLGRYRFTISHEIGHIRLHGGYLTGLAITPDSDMLTGPTILDEQVDRFASLPLMPEAVVQQAWAEDTIAFG